MTVAKALGPGSLKKHAGRWKLDYTDARGYRRRIVLGPDKRVAERRRAELIRRRDMQLDGLGGVDGQQRPVRELVEVYLEDLAARVTDRHLLNVRGKLDRVLDWLGEVRVRDLRTTDAIRLRGELIKSGLANRTVNLHLDVLRAMLRWAVEAGLIAENPLKHLRRLPEHPRYRRRAMSDDEIARFLAASEADDAENARRGRVPQTPLWAALLDTGARWSELRQVTWGDVDLAARTLVLRAETTKARRQRAIPLRAELVERLRGLRPVHQTALRRLPTVADRVFLSPDGATWKRPTTNPMRIFDRVLERAGIARVDQQGRKLDIHALRHTFGTRLARAGVGLVQAQRLMGHSDPKLTAGVYTHLGIDELRSSIDRLCERELSPTVVRKA